MSPEVVKSLEETFGAPPTISTDTLVRRVLPKIKKNKAIIVEPRQMRILWYLYRIAPAFVLNIFTKGWLAMKHKLKKRTES